jgi:DNA mismatch repair protein MutS2
VACASFGYHPETYEPTYVLTLGAPGRSLALEMAERLGLPPEAVADARARLNAKDAQAEALLARLEQEQALARRERARIEDERRALDEALARQQAAERELEARKRSEVERFRRELQRRGEEAARKAADAVQQAVRKVEGTQRSQRALAAAGGAARVEALRAIREAQEEVLQAPELAPYVAPAPEPSAEPVTVGCRVRVRSLGALVGEVLALDAHGEAELAVSGKRLRVPQAELVVIAPPRVVAPAGVARAAVAARAAAGGGGAVATVDGGTAEVQIIGLRVDEALPKVDKTLDDAALADRRYVRVVHGYGQGKLRQAVAELLQGHPHVAAFGPADAREGGAAVTVVELKE